MLLSYRVYIPSSPLNGIMLIRPAGFPNIRIKLRIKFRIKGIPETERCRKYYIEKRIKKILEKIPSKLCFSWSNRYVYILLCVLFGDYDYRVYFWAPKWVIILHHFLPLTGKRKLSCSTLFSTTIPCGNHPIITVL